MTNSDNALKTNAPARPRFLIVGFDGLRPDAVTAEEMPALTSFLAESHVWTNYRADFPTETYVNHPGIFSGFRPTDHGVIANTYFRRGMKSEEAVFRGSSVESVLAHERFEGGCGVIAVPSIGDRLGERGMTMRVYCANSVGSTRLQHVHADRYATHVVACVHKLEATEPANARETLVERYGDGVPLEFPDIKGSALTVELFFKEELREGGTENLGDVTVLWIGEPDHSSHEFGLWDNRTRAARRHADDEFARVLAWWRETGRDAGVQLVVLSDHGHGVVRRHISMTGILEKAGFKVATGRDVARGLDPKTVDAVLVGSYTSGLWLTDPTVENLLRARDALMASPDIGMLFSQPDEARPDAVEGRVPGTFSEALVFTDNDRSPDLRIVPRGNPATGDLVMGRELELGTGNHGGLLPQELSCVFAIAGSRFPGKGRHTEPARHADAAVTIMDQLGLLDDEALLPLPTGRLLVEAMEGGCTCTKGALPPVPAVERLQLTCGSFTQVLERINHAGRTYLTAGYRTSDDGWCAETGLPEDVSEK